MRLFPNLPLRHRLTLSILMVSLVALLLAGGSFILYEQFAFKRDLVSDVDGVARIIGYETASAVSFNDSDSAEISLAGLQAKPHISAACIYDKNGRVFATYRPEATQDFGPAVEEPIERFGPDRLEVFRPITLSGERIGTLYLRSDLGEMNERLRRYAAIMGVVVLVAMLVAYLLALQLQRAISGPVAQLASIADQVATAKDYSVRAVKNSNDELGRLIEGFNHMLGQIEARDRVLRTMNESLEKRTAALQRENEERQRAERALQASEIFLQSLVENLPVNVFRKDRECRIMFGNKRYCDRFGLSPEKLIGKRVSELQPGPRADDWEKIDRGVMESGKMHESVDEVHGPDGQLMFFHALKVPVFDHTGQCVGVQGILLDITERRQAQRQLASSLSVLHATLEATTEGIFVADGEGRMTHFNRKFAEMWRIPVDVIKTRDNNRALEFVLPQLKDPEGFTRKLHELQARPEDTSFDVIEFTDGRVFERYTQPQRIDGTIAGRVWSFRDVTDRKRAEAELAATHRQLLETSRQAGMAEVATGVLHNVGNVLNSVNVSATLVMDHVRQSKAANVAKLSALFNQHRTDLGRFITQDPRGQMIPDYLDTLTESLAGEHTAITTELEHLRKNIEHIKDIVVMQQSYARHSGFLETVSLPDLIEDALRMNAGSLARHDVEVTRDYQARPVITTDKHKVMQILINLVRNAKYACDESGRTGKRVVVRTTADDRSVRIAVIDNGVGIVAENLTRIFAHGFTTRKHGHGFGLHSGALAAKELGGKISVQSDGPGTGATFVLELPFKAEKAPS